MTFSRAHPSLCWGPCHPTRTCRHPSGARAVRLPPPAPPHRLTHSCLSSPSCCLRPISPVGRGRKYAAQDLCAGTHRTLGDIHSQGVSRGEGPECGDTCLRESPQILPRTAPHTPAPVLLCLHRGTRGRHITPWLLGTKVKLTEASSPQLPRSLRQDTELKVLLNILVTALCNVPQRHTRTCHAQAPKATLSHKHHTDPHTVRSPQSSRLLTTHQHTHTQ